MSLVERLGYKTLTELYEHMDCADIMQWMAYDMLKDKDTREKLTKEVSLANQKDYTAEQEALAMKQMLMGLQK